MDRAVSTGGIARSDQTRTSRKETVRPHFNDFIIATYDAKYLWNCASPIEYHDDT
jgi:hypothetical protein